MTTNTARRGLFVIWHFRNNWGQFSPRWRGIGFSRVLPIYPDWRLRLGYLTISWGP